MPLFDNTSGQRSLRAAFVTHAQDAVSIRLAAPFFSYANPIELMANKGKTISLIVRLGPVTSPHALRRVLAHESVRVRYFTSARFHSKIYIFGESGALVGSANLTDAGFQSNREAVLFVEPTNPDFDELVRLFESYWSQAEVLDESRLARYERVWRGREHGTAERELTRDIEAEFGESAPVGIQVGGPQPSGEKLYLEDYKRQYQVFLSAFREVEDRYARTRRRKENRVPLRIEIDQFFNYLRQYHATGQSYLEVKPLSRTERAERLEEYLTIWWEAKFTYLTDQIPTRYALINRSFGSPAAIREADLEQVLAGLEVCHSFDDQFRFHLGGMDTMRNEFRRQTDIVKARKSLEYLLYGRDDFVERMGSLIFDPHHELYRCGRSVVQELLGWVNGEDIPICNGRTLKVLRFLGHDVPLRD